MQNFHEVRMSFSKPPRPQAVKPAPKTPQELAHYDRDLAAYQLALKEDKAAQERWKQAREMLDFAARGAERDMRFHDNDYGAVGKYDLNPEVGVMAYRASDRDWDCEVFGRSSSVRLPGHFWEKAHYGRVVTHYHYESGRHGQPRTHHRDYEAALSNSKFPQIVWERACRTDYEAGTRVSVEVNHRDDVMVYREEAGPAFLASSA